MQYDVGEADFRKAGFERLAEALILYNSGFFAGSVYLGGRAVEGMLRAVTWKHDHELRTGKQSLETGHDLRRLLSRVNSLGVVKDKRQRDSLAENIRQIGRLWFNNMRFVPTARMEKSWWKAGEIGKRQSLKRAVSDFNEVCSSVVQTCEALCKE
jgi:HEPN domain-containing protein